MFQLVKEPIAWIDVEWSGLDEEGFEQTNSIRMQVVFLPLSEIEKIAERELATIKFGAGIDLTEAERALLATPAERTVDFAKRVVRNWSGILGPDKKPLPFNAKNLEMVIDCVPGFGAGFGPSYNNAWRGQGKAREKNFESSPSDGRADAAGETKPPA